MSDADRLLEGKITRSRRVRLQKTYVQENVLRSALDSTSDNVDTLARTKVLARQKHNYLLPEYVSSVLTILEPTYFFTYTAIYGRCLYGRNGSRDQPVDVKHHLVGKQYMNTSGNVVWDFILLPEGIHTQYSQHHK